MVTMKKLLLISLLFCVLLTKAQHSPYFFPDSVYDEGIIDDEHRAKAGQIYFFPDESKYVDNLIKDEDGVYELRPFGEIKCILYLKHSVRYYYEKYLKDAKMNKEDWDYRDKIGDKGRVVYGDEFSYLVFVLKVNGKLIKSWREPLYAYAFLNWTQFDYKIWYRQEGSSENYDNYKYMNCEPCHYPLYDYLSKNVTKGSYKVELEVYPGMMKCNSIEDKGPDIMAKGEFILTIDGSEAKAIKNTKKSKNTPFDFIKKIRLTRKRR